jgi:hypothetical protein
MLFSGNACNKMRSDMNIFWFSEILIFLFGSGTLDFFFCLKYFLYSHNTFCANTSPHKWCTSMSICYGVCATHSDHVLKQIIFFSNIHDWYQTLDSLWYSEFMVSFGASRIIWVEEAISPPGNKWLFIKGVFDLKNEVIHQLFSPWLFVFGLWNGVSWYIAISFLIRLIISICKRNGLIPPKLMGYTHDASPHETWGDSTNQTHHKLRK